MSEIVESMAVWSEFTLWTNCSLSFFRDKTRHRGESEREREREKERESYITHSDTIPSQLIVHLVQPKQGFSLEAASVSPYLGT